MQTLRSFCWCVCSLVLVLGGSSAQGLSGQHATIGLAGGHVSSWSESEWEDGFPGPTKATSNGNRSGIAPSIYVWKDVLPWVGIQTELAITPRGFVGTQPSYSLTYVEAIGSIDIRPFPEAEYVPYIRVGLGPAWITDCFVQSRETVIGPVEGQCEQVQTPWQNDYGVARRDVTILAGLGVERGVEQYRLRAEARLGRGILKVYNSGIFDYNYFATVQFSLGRAIDANE